MSENRTNWIQQLQTEKHILVVLRLARCCHLLVAGKKAALLANPPLYQNTSGPPAPVTHVYLWELYRPVLRAEWGSYRGGYAVTEGTQKGWLRFRRGVYFWDMSQRNTIFKVSGISFPRESGYRASRQASSSLLHRHGWSNRRACIVMETITVL